MTQLQILTAGESHGPELLVILEGIPAGLSLPNDVIDQQLARRQRGYGAGARMRIERDRVEIVSGVMAGKTMGAPIGMRIANLNHSAWKGKAIPSFTTPRPGHADLTGALKYGYRDLRPALERASARETAARVAAGAICRHLLAQLDIQMAGWVSAIGETALPGEWAADHTLDELIQRTEASEVRCPHPEIAQDMHQAIRQAKIDRDTLGGVLEVRVEGLPPGLGSFSQPARRLDARLGGAVLSIPAVKGVEIGPAFDNATRSGTEVHDPIRLEGNDLVRPSNRAGGLEGGMTNGQPLHVRAAMKPIATTLTPQRSVDLGEEKEADTQYERSDVCPVPRAVPILEAVIAFVLTDALLEKLGGDSLEEIQKRYRDLPRARLSDLSVADEDHVWWPDEE
jgi:chorismate synthase